jgi:hypothetical protein
MGTQRIIGARMKVYPRIEFGGVLFNQSRAAKYFRSGCPLPGTVTFEDHDADITTATTPAADPAPWYDAAVAVSAGFFGCWVSEVGGIDTATSTRTSVSLAGGGSTAGGWGSPARGIPVTGLMFAASVSSMQFGQRWLTRLVLRDTTRKATVRIDNAVGADTGLRDLFDVFAAEPPRYTPVDGTDGLVCQFEIAFIAGDPHLYRQDLTTVIATAAPSTGLAIASTTYVCPTPAAPFTLACDPLEALPVLPFGATFDRWARPSCGPGSAAYLNGKETIVFDDALRPSSGAGSAHWLDVPGEEPVFDFARRSSCGASSSGFGSSVASSWYDLVYTAAATAVDTWTHETITCNQVLESSSFDPARYTKLDFESAGSLIVRNVKVWLFAVNEHGTVDGTVYGYAEYLTGNGTPGDQYVTLQDAMPQVGGVPVIREDIRYRVVFEFEHTSTGVLMVHLDTAGSATSRQPSGRNCAAPAAGPNAGVDRTLATACVTALTVAPSAVVASLPNGYAERIIGDNFGQIDHWLRPTGHTTPPDGLWQPSDATSLAGALAAISAESDGSSMPGLVTPSGFAWSTFTFAALTSAVCAGSDVRWVRLRARAWSPTNGTGPFESGNPSSAWTLRAVLDSGAGVVTPIVAAGEFMSSDEWTGQERSWVFRVTQAQATQLRVVASFAAQASPGAVAGRLEFVALDTEFVGSGGCLDCGPNVTDVPCVASSPFPSTCWTEPAAVHVLGATHDPGRFDAVPLVTVVAGGSAAKNLRVRWWDTVSGHTTPQASLGEWQYWKCATRTAEMEIPEIPAGWTLTVDGRTKSLSLTNGSTTVDASRLVTGKLGGPWVWPVFDSPTAVAVDSDDTAAPSTVQVRAALREIDR